VVNQVVVVVRHDFALLINSAMVFLPLSSPFTAFLPVYPYPTMPKGQNAAEKSR
jgi:hypothetical protein